MVRNEDKITVYGRIQEEIRRMGILSPEEVMLLPKRWKRIGHVLILDLKRRLVDKRFEIGAIYLKYIPRIRTVLWRKAPTDLTIRTPHYEIIAGEDNTVTIFREHGVRYILDVARLTFSAGNHHERLRLVGLVRGSSRNERILDMFACIGNLSMPLAVHVPTVKVVGVEVNPLAYMYLRKTIGLNDVWRNYQPVLGDNRKVSLEGGFDRIIMGYFGISDFQLRRAIQNLNPVSGGWIHLHELQPENRPPELPQKLQNLLEVWKKEEIISVNFVIKEWKVKKVKWVAPRLRHVVSDVRIVPSSS